MIDMKDMKQERAEAYVQVMEEKVAQSYHQIQEMARHLEERVIQIEIETIALTIQERDDMLKQLRAAKAIVSQLDREVEEANQRTHVAELHA